MPAVLTFKIVDTPRFRKPGERSLQRRGSIFPDGMDSRRLEARL